MREKEGADCGYREDPTPIDKVVLRFRNELDEKGFVCESVTERKDGLRAHYSFYIFVFA